jgi:hypothetical protein
MYEDWYAGEEDAEVVGVPLEEMQRLVHSFDENGDPIYYSDLK